LASPVAPSIVVICETEAQALTTDAIIKKLLNAVLVP